MTERNQERGDDNSVIYESDGESTDLQGVVMQTIYTHSTLRRNQMVQRDPFKTSCSTVHSRGLKQVRVQREEQRANTELLRREKTVAKILCPLPNEAMVGVYEHLFCQLTTCLEKVQDSEFPHIPVLARTSVFLGFACIDIANVLNNTLTAHCDTNAPRQTRRGRQGRRGLVTSYVNKFVAIFETVSEMEQNRILSDYDYERNECCKASLTSLKAMYQRLSEKYATIANEFYTGSQTRSLFQVTSAIDLAFVYIGRKELILHLSAILSSLEKASELLKFLELPEYGEMCLRKVLEALDAQQLNFLCPTVLPNVEFTNNEIVDETEKLNILVYLKESHKFFLSGATFLSDLELQLCP